jgi:choline dehydrogenase
MRWDFFVKHYSENTQALKDNKMVWKLPDGTWYTGLDPLAGATQLGLCYGRAATLGGCSTHNAGITVLPPEKDWTDIAALTGDTSWSLVNLRRYFKKMENNFNLPNTTPCQGFSSYLGVNVMDPAPANTDPQMIEAARDSQQNL